MSRSILFWRRLDVEGLERLELTVAPHAVTAVSTVLCLEDGGLRMAHRWQLDAAWRAQRLGPRRLRYVDLGVAAGFEAELEVDGEGLVLRYEPLFERVMPAA
jgi:hypothetical protein